MKITLPLDKMTTAEKLATMEELWEDLSHSQESMPSPAWHGTVLAERELQVKEGKASFTDLAKTKDRIRKATR